MIASNFTTFLMSNASGTATLEAAFFGLPLCVVYKVAWLTWIVARPGGWSGYTSRGYKPPGPKTVHLGLLRLDQILLGWRLANRSANL